VNIKFLEILTTEKIQDINFLHTYPNAVLYTQFLQEQQQQQILEVLRYKYRKFFFCNIIFENYYLNKSDVMACINMGKSYQHYDIMMWKEEYKVWTHDQNNMVQCWKMSSSTAARKFLTNIFAGNFLHLAGNFCHLIYAI
jgi:hypothetical protein